jgi:hypothetical protein
MAITVDRISDDEWRITHTHEKNKFDEHIIIDSEEIIELAEMLKERGF